MLIVIDDVLSADEVESYRDALGKADWNDGVDTAGSLSTTVKNNQQVNDHCEIGRALSNALLSRIGNHPQFISAAIPNEIHAPRFNRYGVGETYGIHVDGSIMPMPHTNRIMRADLSATLFLSDPSEYEGGELTIETQYGLQEVKLPAGSLVLYPSSSLHQVRSVHRGERLAAICWIQSLVRDEQLRGILFDLDESIQVLTLEAKTNRESLLRLSNVYHNLLRKFADI